jgi:Ser/Thr protein kinase RdoA (MazF antagonist)
MADDAELVHKAAQRLEQAWQREVPVGDVMVALTDRCVFVTVGPSGTPVVVKADTRPGRIAAERHVTLAARAAGVPVPAIVPAQDIVPGERGEPPLLVLEYLPGRPLGADTPASAWAEAGRVLRRLHAMADPGGLRSWPERPPPDAGAGSGLPLRSVLAGHAAREAAGTVKRGLLSSEQAARLGRLLGEAFSRSEARSTEDPANSRVLHGDCQPDHFLLAGHAAHIAAVLDLGDACTGDPVWDLAVLTLDYPARMDDVLAGYAPPPDLSRRVSVLAGPYRLLRWLREASWLHDHGYDPGPSIAPVRAVAG